MNRLTKAFKTITQLGIKQTGLFVLYKFGLITGHFERVLADLPSISAEITFQPLLPIPLKEEILTVLGEEGLTVLLGEADAIVEKELYHQFGGPLAPITLVPPTSQPMRNWTAYETGQAVVDSDDIKYVWEPARFGWAIPLARAALLTGDAKYADKFWSLFQTFQEGNSYRKGPNWQSGQEVAVRLTTVLLCAPVFLLNDPMEGMHQKQLIKFIVEHATRIPPTLVYARAQNNNHLLTEALGLLCAGYALPDYPEAVKWRKMGYRWLQDAFKHQITDTGEYIQYSNNYHRVMLDAALVASGVLNEQGESWPQKVLEKLISATRWLLAEVDPLSGRTANYGHNDGAQLFSFANGGFSDYRPAVQAAGALFFQKPIFPPGKWDEKGLWLGLTPSRGQCLLMDSKEKIIPAMGTWASLRGHMYHNRPGHADQNHVDLWWKGEPIALDAGTYRYNANPPWENQLMTSAVHNTITVDGQDQMLRAGRFLWLDWSVAKVTKESENKLVGIQDGYCRLRVMHRRTIESLDATQWQVEDNLIPLLATDETMHEFQLHWLLPDWNWELNGTQLTLFHENRKVVLSVKTDNDIQSIVQLCHAGEVVHGEGTCIPQLGWYSPTYSVKEPALSYVFKIKCKAPVRITSDWLFEES